MKFGVNTWVWTSPLTTTELEKLAPLVAGVSFDWIEVPLESLDDLDPRRVQTSWKAIKTPSSAMAFWNLPGQSGRWT